MQLRVLSVLLVTAVAVTAQNSLTTTFAHNNSGAVGGVVFCDLVVNGSGLTITDLDLNLVSPAGTSGTIDVYTAPVTSFGKEGTMSLWTLLTSDPATSAGPGLPSNVALTAPLSLANGSSIGLALVASGLAHGYTTATAPFPLVHTGCSLSLIVNGGSNAPFTGTLFSPRAINTTINFSPMVACASATPHGAGCGRLVASFYEMSSPVSFDLGSRRVIATNNGAGYDVSTSGGPGITVGAGATALVLGDDTQVAVGTLGLTVGSNCWVAFGPGNSNGFAPNVAALLTNAATAIYSWTDLQPDAAGSGPVMYEEFANIAIVTYDGVFGWGTTDPNTVQFTIDTVSGDFCIEWGAVSVTNPENWLVGYSLGGASADPGGIDITANPFSIASSEAAAVSLSAIGRPVQGLFGSPFQVRTDNIPSSALSHMALIGVTSPGAPLGGVGMPGCSLYASLDILDLVLFPPPATSSFTWTALTLPAGPPFLSGLEFHVQSVIFGTSINAFIDLGALTSNGLKCVVGLQ